MPFGLQTFNDQGQAQINDEVMYGLHSKGSATVGQTINVPAGALVFLADMTAPVYADVPTAGGVVHFYSPQGDGVSFNYYVFARTDTIKSNSRIGLQAFDANGRLVFDSATPALRIAAVATTTKGDPPQSLHTRGNGKYAVCMLAGLSLVPVVPMGEGFIYFFYAWCVSLRAGQVQATHHRVKEGPYVGLQDISITTQGGSLLIADVTGL